jgi:hypothetical protein
MHAIDADEQHMFDAIVVSPVIIVGVAGDGRDSQGGGAGQQ